jgi:hypothetical protein
MMRSIATNSMAIRAVVAIAAVAAISYCSAVSRAETLSPATTAGHVVTGNSQGLLGSFGMTVPTESSSTVSTAVLSSLAAGDQPVAYHAALSTPSFGRQVVQKAPGMGFGFESVPFESFLSVAAAPNGENVIRTFIIIQNDKSDADSSLGKASGEDLVNKFTQASAGSTTTSGSATLSILQVPPASSSLVFTNVLLKDAAHVTE